MPSSRIQEFVQALDEEIEASKKRGGRNTSIFNGKFLREVSRYYLYKFHLENFLVILDETPGKIEIKGVAHPATILSSHELEVEIAIDTFVGETIPEARLTSNISDLLEKLKELYLSALNGTIQPDFNLSEILFSGTIPENIPQASVEALINVDMGHLNDAQKRAVEASFLHPLCIIWGPPGTGKTKTIAQATEAHLRAGRRVLLVSHANNAVDEALEFVAEHLKSHPIYQEGKIIRLGTPREDHLKRIEKDYSMVLLQNIVAIKGKELVEKRAQIGREKRNLDEQISKLSDIRSKRIELERLQSDINYVHELYEEESMIMKRLKQDNERVESIIHTLRENLNNAETALLIQKKIKDRKVVASYINQYEQELQTLALLKQDNERVELTIYTLREKLNKAKTAGRIVNLFRGLNINKIEERIEFHLGEYSQLQKQISDKDNKVKLLNTTLQDKKSVFQELNEDIEGYMANNHLSNEKFERMLNSLNTKTIEHQIQDNLEKCSKIERQVPEQGNKVERLTTVFQEKKKLFQELNEDIEHYIENLHILKEDIDRIYWEYSTKSSHIREELNSIDQQIGELEKSILQEAQLVATTLTKTYISKQFPSEPFDTLIVDEVSMAPLPQLYWAASHCRQYVTIVGDFLQLPPICQGEDAPMAYKWLGRSIFKVLSIDSVNQAISDPRVTLLDTQYRMLPAISYLPNTLFYQGKLKNDPSTSNRPAFVDGISELPLALIETSKANPWCSKIQGGGRFNLYNAIVSSTLAREVSKKLENQRVGIVTPYAAQARLINKIVKDWGMLERIRVSTVHSFQGGQEDVIIFDSVEGHGLRIAQMLYDKMMLNVAITRAKNRFYFIGYTNHLLRELDPNASLAWLIKHIQKNGTVIQSGDLVKNYSTDDFDKWADVSILSSTTDDILTKHYSENNFWNQFFQDLRTAQKRLIILSPFITIRRTDKMMNYLRTLSQRGVSITIYTRPPEQQSNEMENQSKVVIDQFRSVNIKVNEWLDMHQKVAIVDESIVWTGSLNILSHRDTHEFMTRVEGPAAVEEVIKTLRLKN